MATARQKAASRRNLVKARAARKRRSVGAAMTRLKGRTVGGKPVTRAHVKWVLENRRVAKTGKGIPSGKAH